MSSLNIKESVTATLQIGSSGGHSGRERHRGEGLAGGRVPTGGECVRAGFGWGPAVVAYAG